MPPAIPGLELSPEQRASRALQTPFMRQWFSAKERYPDALIFFRMGDFYELFLDDAVRGAKAFSITLTSRNKGEADEIPMAGVPYHQAHVYLGRALQAGLSVAIVEQMGDPAKCKGLVPREVVRVVTPGLVVEETSLTANENHWLVVVEVDPVHGHGLAAFDHSTGELLACAPQDPLSVFAELARFEPREVLVGPGATELLEVIGTVVPRAVVRRDTAVLEDEVALQTLSEHLGAATAAESTRSAPLLVRRAAARVLAYAQSRTPSARITAPRLALYDPIGQLQLDESTAQHLELVRSVEGGRSLLAEIDETRTPFGARLLRRWLLAPLCEVSAIRRRHDAVEVFVLDAAMRRPLRDELARLGDLERLATRAMLGQISPRELGALRDGLGRLPTIERILQGALEPEARGTLGLDRPLDCLADLHDVLVRALVEQPPPVARDGGIFQSGWDVALDELAALRRDGDSILLKLEASLREESGIQNLKLRFNKVFGWYLEVSRTNLERVPASWKRKQTVATGERYTTDALESLQDKLLSAEDRHKERELELFELLRRDVATRAERIRAVTARLAHWDVVSALAEVAHRNDYVRPVIDDSLRLSLVESRHPVVEHLVPARAGDGDGEAPLAARKRGSSSGRFVPNDVELSAETGGERLWIITGPNMAGKSTLMRQVALAVIMAQAGSFVPAQRAHIGLVDRVMTRVGASDNLARGASTFMVEMRETAHILRRATRRSLVVLDEIGRGTSTYDGLAIAWAVAEHLHDAVGARTLFATHYHELTELAETRPGVGNRSVAAREIGDEVVFLHRLVEGGASRSYGVAVARLAGVPEGVLARARALLASLERGATLPSGRHASMRGRTASGNVQLDMFGTPEEPQATESRKTSGGGGGKSHPAVETLRQVDLNRLSPIEAWQLVSTLKGLIGS